MRVLQTIIGILRIVSLLIWIAIGVVTLWGTWAVFQRTIGILDAGPENFFKSLTGGATPDGSPPPELLKFLPRNTRP